MVALATVMVSVNAEMRSLGLTVNSHYVSDESKPCY